jgi:hypothetical protein
MKGSVFADGRLPMRPKVAIRCGLAIFAEDIDITNFASADYPKVANSQAMATFEAVGKPTWHLSGTTTTIAEPYFCLAALS